MRKNEKTTTIQITESTKRSLKNLKIVESEPFDGVIRRMLNVLSEERIDKETMRLINERLRDVRSGNVMSTKQLRGKLFRRNNK